MKVCWIDTGVSGSSGPGGRAKERKAVSETGRQSCAPRGGTGSLDVTGGLRPVSPRGLYWGGGNCNATEDVSAWGVGQQKVNLWDLTGGYGSWTAVGSVSVQKKKR